MVTHRRTFAGVGVDPGKGQLVHTKQEKQQVIEFSENVESSEKYWIVTVPVDN